MGNWRAMDKDELLHLLYDILHVNQSINQPMKKF